MAPTLATPRNRAELARIALRAARSVDGVAGVSGADRFAKTWDGERWIEGVSVVAEPGGRYSLSLRLVVELVSMDRLAHSVRERIAAEAAGHGFAGKLGEVRISIDDVQAPAHPVSG